MVLQSQNIICFAKDWNEIATSNNHVMEELARNNRVLWLNSVSTRKPNLASKRDLGRIFAKVGGFLKGPQQVAPSLWIYTPMVIPLPHNRFAKALNRLLLRVTLKQLRRRLGMREFQLWTFLPNVGDYLDRLGESCLVYYCVDEWSLFNYVDGPRIAEAERQLCRRADVVFAVAQSLVEKRRQINPETHLARHGVDQEKFAAALRPEMPLPSDVAGIPRPIIGFCGTLQDWIDFDLLEQLASRRPDWSFVLLGKVLVDVSRFQRFENVHFLGPRPHGQLPNYCKAFSVGIIPYILNERILQVNPVKLREYLSAGLPVVSVPLPEVAGYEPHCTIARSAAEFERAIDAALKNDSPELRRQRSELMRAETWSARVADVTRHVMRVKGLKCKRSSVPA